MTMCKQIKKIYFVFRAKVIGRTFDLRKHNGRQVKIPESLSDIYMILYTGNANAQCSARKSHMIEGSSFDAKFCLLWRETNSWNVSITGFRKILEKK